MKKFLLIGLALLPVVSFAQQWELPASNDEFAYASIFSGNFSLLLSIVIGAIADALSEYGIRDITMPATPYAVWQAIQEAKAAD